MAGNEDTGPEASRREEVEREEACSIDFSQRTALDSAVARTSTFIRRRAIVNDASCVLPAPSPDSKLADFDRLCKFALSALRGCYSCRKRSGTASCIAAQPTVCGDGQEDQGSRNPSLSASSQASSSDLRRTSRLSSTAGIFDLDDDGSIDGASTSSSGGRRASNARVSSLGGGSHRGSVADRGSRNLFDVQEEDTNTASAPSPGPPSTSSSASKAATRSQLSADTFVSATQFTDPFSSANRNSIRLSPSDSDNSRRGGPPSSFPGDDDACDPKSSPSSSSLSPSASSPLSQAARSNSERSNSLHSIIELGPPSPTSSAASAAGKHPRSDQPPSPTRSFKHSRVATSSTVPRPIQTTAPRPHRSSSSSSPSSSIGGVSAATGKSSSPTDPSQSQPQNVSQSTTSASVAAHASSSQPPSSSLSSFAPPGLSLSPPSAALKALSRSSSKRMSFDTAPSFSSPLAFASILPNDDDANDDDTLNAEGAPLPSSPVWLGDSASNRSSSDPQAARRRTQGSTSSSQGSYTQPLSPTSPSSVSSATSQPGARQYRQDASDSAASDTVDEMPRRVSNEQRSSMRKDAVTISAVSAADLAGASPLARTSLRLDRERSTSNPLHRAVAGASRLNRTPSRHSPFQSMNVVDDDASSVASDDVATTGSNLTRKSSVTSSSGSMGPPAIPRRIGGGATGSPALEPIDRASTIAMGKRKEDASLGLGMPSNPSPLSSSSSSGLPASSSFHSGSPTISWDARGARSSSGAFAPSSFGTSTNNTPTTVTGGGSAIMHSARRRRMTSSSLSSSVHRRARSLGGVLLGEGAISPVGGPDGVDPNLVAAIESGSPSIPLPVPIPAASGSHRSSSVSSSGTQGGAASSLSSSGVASSSVPFSSSVVARASSHRRRNSQVIEDEDFPRSEAAGRTPSPSHTRSRVRSQTLGIPPSPIGPASAQTAVLETPASTTGSSPSVKSAGSANLADAIRLQRVPTAVRLAGDLIVPPSPSPRNMPKSASTASIESPLSKWTASSATAQHSSPLVLGGTSQGHGLGLGLTSDAASSPPTSAGRLNVPQTPNATRSNSPLAYEYSSGAEESGASGRSSPAMERLRTDQTAKPGHDSSGQPLSVSIPIGRDYGPPASLPSSAILGSRSPTLIPPRSDLLDVPTSAPRHAGLPASTSAYSPLLALNASSARTSPTAERRPRLASSHSITQRMSWGAQELFDSLQEATDGHDEHDDGFEDKPAPWIASTQDAGVQSSLAPAAASLSQRRQTQGNLSSSIGSTHLLGVPPSNRRVHRPSEAALFTPVGNLPTAVHQPMSGTDEYARIIVQSRNAKMQKWRAQNPSRLGSYLRQRNEVATLGGSQLSRERVQNSTAEAPLILGQTNLARRGTTIGLQRDSSMVGAPAPTRRSSAVGSDDSIESQLDEDEDGQRGLESSAFAEFEWVDWLDEYRKMKEAKLQSEREEAEAQAAVEAGAPDAESAAVDAEGSAVHDVSSTTADDEGAASSPRRSGSEAIDNGRVSALQKQPADGHRSVSDPLSRQRLQTAEPIDVEQDAMDAEEVEAALAALSLDDDNGDDAASSKTARASKAAQLGPARRPDPSSRYSTRPGTIQQRSFSLASAELSSRHSGADSSSTALSTLSSSPGPVKAGFSPVKRLGTDKAKNLSLSPITSRVTPAPQYTRAASSHSARAQAHAAGRGRRKHLGGKIEAWWSAVKSGFTAPAGDGWAKPPASTASPRRNEADPRTGSAAALSHSLYQSPSMASARSTGFSQSRRDAPRPAPLSSSAIANPAIATPSPTLVTQVQSGFGRHMRSHTGNTAMSGTDSVKTLRSSTSAQNLGKDLAQRSDESLEVGDRSDRKSASPAADASFVTVQEEPGSLEAPMSASSQQSQETRSSGGRRRHQPKLSLQLDKGLSTFDAEEFDKIGMGKSPSSSKQASPTKPPVSARSDGSTGSAKEVSKSLAAEPALQPALSPRKSSPQLSQAWASSPRIAKKPLRDDDDDRDVDADSDDDEGRAAVRARAASKAITINSIRQHIRHRLLASKESCDRELRRIVGAINNYVELELEKQEDEGRRSVVGDDRDVEEIEEVFAHDPEDAAEEAADSDVVHGGHASTSRPRSRSMSRGASNSSSFSAGAAAAAAAISGTNVSPHEELPESISNAEGSHARVSSGSLFTSPVLGGLREAAAVRSAREYKLPAPPPVNIAAATGTSARTIGTALANPAKPSNLNPLSRAQSLSRPGARSGSNSRSTSRSHSPMPGVMMTSSISASSGSPRLSPSRKMRALPTEDLGPQPWMQPLEELAAIAMEVLDVSINSLIARSGSCSQLISRVQSIGRFWDEHPDWAGRGWFIQILLAIAGLSRVVEWWEAEKGFWNFNDEQEQDAEPIRFILGGQGGDAAGEAAEQESGKSSGLWMPSTANSPIRARALSVAPVDIAMVHRKSTSGSNSPASGLMRRELQPIGDQEEGGTLLSSGVTKAVVDDGQGDLDADADGDMTIVDRARPLPRGKPSGGLEDLDGRAAMLSASDNIQGEQSQEAGEIDSSGEGTEEAPQEVRQNFRSAGINVLMELSMDDQRLLYLSPAWKTVLGSDPAELYGAPIEDLLAPGDTDVFAEASRQLEANQSHTVEAVFRLRVEKTLHASSTSSANSSDDRSDVSDAVYFQEMEGKGMLMIDRQSGNPSHSMWVFKATGPPEREDQLHDAALTKGGRAVAAVLDEPTAALAHVASISIEPVLCRICERDIPAWFFEKHSEICNETHRLDMEIGECNESLRELRRAIQDLHNRLESFTGQSAEQPLEYRGVAITTPPASNQPPSALEGLNRSIAQRQPAPASVRKQHLRALDAAVELLQTACEISTPAIKDEFADQPIEKQRLLSPTSENKVVTVQQWRRPALDDTALDLLMADVEGAMRSKLSAVNRMLNTIVYVETVRQEWEERVEAALSALSEAEEGSGSSRGSSESVSESGSDDAPEQVVDQHEGLGLALAEAQPTYAQVAAAEQGSLPPIAMNSIEMQRGLDSSRGVSTEGIRASPRTPDSLPRATSAHSRLPSTLSTSAGDDEGGAGREDAEDDGLLSGSMLLEQDDRDSPVPPSALFAAMGIAADEDDIPAVDDKMGGSTQPAPIPIPRGGATLAPPPSSTDLLAARPVGSLTAASLSISGVGALQRRSVSRSRRSSHLPSASDGLGGTPPLSPHLYGESLGVSHRQNRKFSVSHKSPMVGSMPLSPRLPPAAPSSRPTASSIKDFDILKPISKGAFGSVFLAKKRTTGDYYAIKVLKKSDMIAKNQITNVKAERMILMTQNQSPFVVKLFFTFQSADFLYLVMEYLPGGDCASLCKVLGGLSEEWARQYIAEVVIGLQHLHSKGVVHRDLKPDNLLIDQKGHLKLTDFGLSKIGLLGRQTRQAVADAAAASSSAPSGFAAHASRSDSNSDSLPSSAASFASEARHPAVFTPAGTTAGDTAASLSPMTPGLGGMMRNQSFFAAPQRGRIVSSSTDASDSGESDSQRAVPKPLPSARIDSPGNLFGAHPLLSDNFGPSSGDGGSDAPKRFVGTPDYLAPESVLGIGMDDFAVDWWALGVILYEFLYGVPPFHAETPEKVFDNILSRRIDWEEDSVEVSSEARDLMERLMCTDPKRRLGSGGPDEIKNHAFFQGIDWDNVTAEPGPFVPQVTDPESTDYFDLRGASHQDFDDEPVHSTREFARAIEGNKFLQTGLPVSRMRSRLEKAFGSQAQNEDFGNFSYKNLPVLKQANDEVIRKMREEQMPALAKALEQSAAYTRHRSFSAKGRPAQRVHSQTLALAGPPSPAQSASSHGSTPSRSTAPTSPAAQLVSSAHRRRTSEVPASLATPLSATTPDGDVGATSSVGRSFPSPSAAMPIGIADRRRQQLVEASSSGERRNSMPSRLRTKSASLAERPALPTPWQQTSQQPQQEVSKKPSRTAANTATTAATATTTASSSPTNAFAPLAPGAAAPPPPAGSIGSSDEIACLIAEDNPIALRMLETMLVKLGCRCTAVRDGAEAVRLAMGDHKFGVMFIDVTLPIVGGEDVTRMVKSTRNVNSTTPIVALASFDRGEPIDAAGSLFDAVLAKPLEKMDVCAILSQLGFTPTQASVNVESSTSMQQGLDGTALSSGSGSGTTSAPAESRALSRKSTLARKTPSQAMAGASTPPLLGSTGSPHHTPYSSSPLGSSVLTSRHFEAPQQLQAKMSSSGLGGLHSRTHSQQHQQDSERRDQETAETLSKLVTESSGERQPTGEKQDQDEKRRLLPRVTRKKTKSLRKKGAERPELMVSAASSRISECFLAIATTKSATDGQTQIEQRPAKSKVSMNSSSRIPMGLSKSIDIVDDDDHMVATLGCRA
ncbi:AGC/NDR protein kinase [Pseudozyma hubeiensis SY62]|uniref:non-specific serine/threonine protein kinase n=1 Tax=Pseudozyma hubeiensis (strain SY62) TaxID=1305764 RepID=R9P598_PSEHS|nr:AGC/NDR protein kinase [Pseudozyma hubeiensis SY62]GAC96489.1 AGC/NDR protein kinase [Pseudozyma hubeiensis SY62]